MTRLITRGFESGILLDEFTTENLGALSTTSRTGTYSAVMGTGANRYGEVAIESTPTEIYMGCAVRINAMPIVGNQAWFRIRSPDSSIYFYPWPDGHFNIYRGTSVFLGGTVTGLFSPNIWHYYEIRVKLDNSTGEIRMKADGVEVFTFSGDTLEGSNTGISAVRLGSTVNKNSYFDDFVVNDTAGGVNDTYPGIISLEPLLPTSAGDNTDLSRGGTDSGSNWGQVDEQPADAVSYVYDTVVDNYDLYNIADLSLPAGAAIQNVIVQGRAQLDSGSGSMALMIKAGTTESDGATQTLAPGWNGFFELWNLNPDDAAAWEDADIDALQIGVKVK